MPRTSPLAPPFDRGRRVAALTAALVVTLFLVTVGGATATAAGRPATHRTPTGAEAAAHPTQVSANLTHSCALMSDATARCWGFNGVGQLGNGTVANSSVPVTVLDTVGTGPLSGITQIAVGQNFTCALLVSTQVRCWGYGHGGQLGNNVVGDSPVPVTVSNPAGTGALTGVTQISAGSGSGHACARMSFAELRCWGANTYGQLGTGTTLDRLKPTMVRNAPGTGALAGVAEVAAGQTHTCARMVDGTARCWGEGQSNGDGSTTVRLLPVKVSNSAGTGPLEGIAQIVAGRHACARLARGGVQCWGANYGGQLGDGTNHQALRPVTVSNATGTGSLGRVAELAAGEGQTCARLGSGAGLCWGYNNHGQIGDGTTTNRLRPVAIGAAAGLGSLSGVVRLGGGGYHTCVIVGSQVQCWGDNQFGQLGDGTTTQRTRPVTVVFP